MARIVKWLLLPYFVFECALVYVVYFPGTNVREYVSAAWWNWTHTPGRDL